MVRGISREEIKNMMDSGESLILVNVLGPEAYENEHICGSINMPVENIVEEAKDLLDKDEMVVVHCAGPACTASRTAAEKLNKAGFRDVRVFQGGIEEWKETGYCLEGNLYREAAV